MMALILLDLLMFKNKCFMSFNRELFEASIVTSLVCHGYLLQCFQLYLIFFLEIKSFTKFCLTADFLKFRFQLPAICWNRFVTMVSLFVVACCRIAGFGSSLAMNDKNKVENENFPCEYCGAVFEKSHLHRKHMKNHVNGDHPSNLTVYLFIYLFFSVGSAPILPYDRMPCISSYKFLARS